MASSSPTPLTLIIRFATSIPDLRLPIPTPTTSNAATLCTLIRPHLPPTLSICPLRLIYAGALLPANKSLSNSLRLSLPPPSGGQAARTSPPQQQQQQQLYIHCSIASDTTLTPAELEAESRAAALLSRPVDFSTPGDNEEDDDAEGEGPTRRAEDQGGSSRTAVENPPVPTPPQGFDRLLAAGLTPPEIASLRSQFLAIQSHTHTPDTMPTAAELRALEERWLDNTSGVNGNGGGGGGGGGGGIAGDGGGGFAGDDTEAGGLEDMLWGNVMGFFWAVGAVVWLVREEGVWSKRRQIGVVTGVLVNLAFCVLRVGS